MRKERSEQTAKVEEQWKSWQANNDLSEVECLSDADLRQLIIDDLSEISQMSVECYTLFKKWHEIHQKYPTREVSTLFGPETQLVDLEIERTLSRLREKIWIAEQPDDYLKVKPKLIYTTGSDLAETNNRLKTFLSTGRNHNNIGRNLYYNVIDETTDKYIGVITVSSDYLDLTVRDNYIGWSREKKTQEHMINHTAVGSTIVGTQPFSYNYLGGKLLSLILLSDEVQNRWQEVYGDKLVGITTTSLYGKNKVGGLSQYSRLKHWKELGFSAGSVSYETTKPVQHQMLKWLEKHHPRKFWEWYVALNANGQPWKRDHRNRSFNFIYSQLKIPKNLIKTEHGRGVYFAPLYNNTNDFLCGNIKESELIKSFPTDIDSLTEIWKTKYAPKRIKALIEQGRVSNEVLWYQDLIKLDWEETKARYLSQVGR